MMSSADVDTKEQQTNDLTFNNNDAKLIVRGLFELEVRLKKEVIDSITPSYQKILGELDVIQQSFGRIFNVLERHDSFLQDVVQKYAQLNGRIDKVMKEQEQMRKRMEGVERLILSSPTQQNSQPPPSGNRSGQGFGQGGRPTFGRFANGGLSPRVDRNVISRRSGGGGNMDSGGGSNVLPMNMPPPPRNFQTSQQFSSTTKMWTRRGSGEFTSDDDSDDENEESDVVVVDKNAETIISSTTIVTKSCTETVTVAAAEENIVVESSDSKVTKKDTPNTADTAEFPFNEELRRLYDANNNKPVARPALQKSDTGSEKVKAEVVADEAPATPPPARGVPSARGGGSLTGGFGNFRRGKPASAVVDEDKAKEDVNKVNNKVKSSPNGSDANFDSPLSVRPLTMDELQVFSKTGRKTPQRFPPIRSSPVQTQPVPYYMPPTQFNNVYSSMSYNSSDLGFGPFGRASGPGFGRGGGSIGKKHPRQRL